MTPEEIKARLEHNTRHWAALFKTDPTARVKEVNEGGRKYTSVDAYARIQRATEHFGAMGDGWGTDAPKVHTIDVGGQTLVVCELALWWRDPGSEVKRYVYEVTSTQLAYTPRNADYVKVDDDAYMKAVTHGISKALSRIGVSADVFMGLFDGDKHAARQEEREEPRQAAPPRQQGRPAPRPQPAGGKGEPKW